MCAGLPLFKPGTQSLLFRQRQGRGWVRLCRETRVTRLLVCRRAVDEAGDAELAGRDDGREGGHLCFVRGLNTSLPASHQFLAVAMKKTVGLFSLCAAGWRGGRETLDLANHVREVVNVPERAEIAKLFQVAREGLVVDACV